jgi:hypothetical protein
VAPTVRRFLLGCAAPQDLRERKESAWLAMGGGAGVTREIETERERERRKKRKRKKKRKKKREEGDEQQPMLPANKEFMALVTGTVSTN